MVLLLHRQARLEQEGAHSDWRDRVSIDVMAVLIPPTSARRSKDAATAANTCLDQSGYCRESETACLSVVTEKLREFWDQRAG
jgi:hypothetical protein